MQTLTEVTFKMLNQLYKIPYLSKANFSCLVAVPGYKDFEFKPNEFSLKDKMFLLLMRKFN